MIFLEICSQMFEDPNILESFQTEIRSADLSRLLLRISSSLPLISKVSIDEFTSESSMEASWMMDTLVLCLEVIAGGLLLVNEDSSMATKEKIMKETSLLSILYNVLQSSADLKTEAIRRLVISSLRCLSNLTCKCVLAQEEIRQRGLLALVLSRTRTNFGLPLAREWAIVCIHNSCGDNLANQQYIADLQVEGKIRTDNVQINIDSKTGKFQFENINPSV